MEYLSLKTFYVILGLCLGFVLQEIHCIYSRTKAPNKLGILMGCMSKPIFYISLITIASCSVTIYAVIYGPSILELTFRAAVINGISIPFTLRKYLKNYITPGGRTLGGSFKDKLAEFL
ncbi:MAG: hypothetical protein AAGU21_05525 [Solidesulfovibrio sp.]|uniref:hypothetical protein n=1 Tax=Solidesulfovibrio sp. TaxID=2910990 RepID=UPI00315861AB